MLQEYWSEYISFEDLNRSINTLPPPRKSATVRISDLQFRISLIYGLN